MAGDVARVLAGEKYRDRANVLFAIPDSPEGLPRGHSLLHFRRSFE